MTTSHQYIIGVFALLFLCTVLIETFVRLRPARQIFRKVRVIIRSWWWIAGALLIALWTGFWGLTALFYLSTLYIFKEYLKHSRLGFKTIAFWMLAVIATTQYAFLIFGYERWFYVFPILAAIWGLPLVIVSRAVVKDLPLAFSSLTGMILLTYFLSYVPALLRFHPDIWTSSDQPAIAVLCLIFLVEVNDILQFLSGKLFGRRKPFPEISPNKTEAGFIGGLLLTSLAAMALLPSALDLSYTPALLLGALLSLTGMFGDLMFSAIKRYFGVKDFSEALPGHGGVLDRLDSLILAAPIYFHILLFLKGIR